MTTTWPSTLEPQTFSVALKKSGLQFRSPFNGTSQAVDFVAERWVFSLALPPKRRVNSGQVEALLFALAGGIERVSCWHFVRPQPMGTLRGTPVLASTASRGNATLSISNATGTNLALNHDFGADTNADGLANGWTSYTLGSPGTVSFSRGASPISGSYQRVTAASLGSTDGDRAGFYSTDIPYPLGATGQLWFDREFPAGCRAWSQVSFFNGAMSFLADVVTEITGAGEAYARQYVPLPSVPATAAFARIYFWVSQKSSGSPYLSIGRVQLNSGAVNNFYAPTTLNAGDMIGSGSQLFMVSADCTADGAGLMTVPIINRVRATINSAAAVTWDKPMVEFIMPAMQPGVSYRPAILEGVPFDLEEVW